MDVNVRRLTSFNTVLTGVLTGLSDWHSMSADVQIDYQHKRAYTSSISDFTYLCPVSFLELVKFDLQ